MIDLYSDTHTIPDEGMRRAMAGAEVGDAQLGEDPTTLHLQERVADLFATEAALFLPTGAMCNKVAIGALTRPDDAVVCDHLAHAYRFEGGGPSALWGVVFEPIVTPRGQFTSDQLAGVMNPGSVYQPRTSLVCLEPRRAVRRLVRPVPDLRGLGRPIRDDNLVDFQRCRGNDFHA